MGPYFTKNGFLLGPYLKAWESLFVLETVSFGRGFLLPPALNVRTKGKKIPYCDVRAVSHSCDVLMSYWVQIQVVLVHFFWY